MKHGTPGHIKMRRLARLLGIPRTHAVGLMACLWDAAPRCALSGDIGRLSDEEIADVLDWPGDPTALVDALVAAGWLDRDSKHRLVIHDWDEHSEMWIKKRARDAKVALLHRGDESRSVTVNGTVVSTVLDKSDSHSLSSEGRIGEVREGEVRLGQEEGTGEKPSAPPPIPFPNQRRLMWGDVEPLYAAYPKHRRGGQGKAQELFGRAIGDLEASGRSDATAWLLARVVAYAKSWQATRESGQYCISLERFIGDGVYKQDDGDWSDPKANGHANLDRIMEMAVESQKRMERRR